MQSATKIILFLALLLPVFLNAQDNTVFITASDPIEEKKQFDEGLLFIQYAFAVPLGANPQRNQIDKYTQDNVPWLLPDGLSFHGGVGIHLNRWVGIGANTGVDWKLQKKLIAIPVYASVFLNPHFSAETSAFLQAGLGQSFAIGRGRLNGTYQKYRAGILFDDLLIFAEANFYGYPLKNTPEMGSLSIGLSLINL